VPQSLEVLLAAEARFEYASSMPSDYQTPLAEQLYQLVFESAISDGT